MSVSFVSFRIARILSRESACRIRSSCTYRKPTDAMSQENVPMQDHRPAPSAAPTGPGSSP